MIIELTREDQIVLTQLAQATDRSENEIAADVMHWFLHEQDKSFAEAVQEGDDDFGRGDVVEHDEVVAQFADVLRHK